MQAVSASGVWGQGSTCEQRVGGNAQAESKGERGNMQTVSAGVSGSMRAESSVGAGTTCKQRAQVECR